jgi:hypothetical protein
LCVGWTRLALHSREALITEQLLVQDLVIGHASGCFECNFPPLL